MAEAIIDAKITINSTFKPEITLDTSSAQITSNLMRLLPAYSMLMREENISSADYRKLTGKAITAMPKGIVTGFSDIGTYLAKDVLFDGTHAIIKGLLKNAHLRCCPANPNRLHTLMYAPSLNLLSALNLNIFEQPPKLLFFNSPINELHAKMTGQTNRADAIITQRNINDTLSPVHLAKGIWDAGLIKSLLFSKCGYFSNDCTCPWH